ncbi:DUF1697 domain-containing protein [Deinococcus metallilatus]|uniref:DUF1697 domain-containing protein n=1 Tax=Deinococcus metallilatus TaxID=1211322 RepID=A0AAJ5F2H3_9DEIO|nr:DUF1697 domain-containing protein [Deinococcus metallilatus]MBB5296169.1 uncharacterized protein (DUF1697 family) [Deinococcus metallilatus]QBY09781.1 DUF1697 domain-containing protein [Deinococcus metallilatus]RXJ08979.1 DUF1697 domain-containing protein [Deinococcus metallilatus]TLK23642.1 DUF1697 domain-containing protein [Deinococcus metallilatus]GMA14035.1 hypothetical protein GCM10025871_03660 [Deinococcus metallilatus]
MKHVALLRGINVGGNRKVPMKDLKATFERLGFRGVQTYIQSGNVVFQAEKVDQAAIEEALRLEFGFPVDVMLRSAAEWSALAPRNPYPAQAAADGTKVHVAFLHQVPTAERLDALSARASGEDTWVCLGRELYLHTPGGLGQSKLNLTPLKQAATVRNWRTVENIGELLEK